MPPKPFCFMVMPFGRKTTQAEPGKGPAEIDFNGLWDEAFFPLLEELGYQPVRADQETGALIVNQMLERLYFSDLVLADLTIPNGNVYYEIGIRHAACRAGCVLLAADWSKQLFDVAQMRTVRYPLASGDLDDAAARAVRDALRPSIAKMSRGASPMYEVLPGYPAAVDDRHATGVRDQVEALAAFQAEMRALRAMPADLRKGLARKVIDRYSSGPMVPSVAIGLLRLLVSTMADDEGWQEVVAFIEGLAPEVAEEAYVREQRALALGKLKRYQESIAELEALIATAGDSAERQGLLGGRYKQLMRSAATPQHAAFYRNQAIEHYERGMMLDLNEFFCSSNLPRLYRARGGSGDESSAQAALQATIAACERAMKRGSTDEWVRPSLLGAAFDFGDADKAESLAEQVIQEGGDAWKLDTSVKSLAESVELVQAQDVRGRLLAILDRLRPLCGSSS